MFYVLSLKYVMHAIMFKPSLQWLWYQMQDCSCNKKANFEDCFFASVFYCILKDY